MYFTIPFWMKRLLYFFTMFVCIKLLQKFLLNFNYNNRHNLMETDSNHGNDVTLSSVDGQRRKRRACIEM